MTICGHDAARAEQAADRLGGGTRWVIADLADPREGERFVTRAAGAMSGLDILVTNAPGPPAGHSPQWRWTIPQALELNAQCRSHVRGCGTAHAARWLGRIVAITSISVRQPIANLILSNTARAGATGFSKPSPGRSPPTASPSIRFSQVCETGRVRGVYGDGLDDGSRRYPTAHSGGPEDFGAAAAFLCSDQARYITGVALPVDGGVYQALQ